jgi:hypothetical protein
VSLKTRAKCERAVTWWNPAVQTRPVLTSLIFLFPRTNVSQQICHHSASSVLAVRISVVAALSQWFCSASPCSGSNWLAHPPSQDILSSIHHNLSARLHWSQNRHNTANQHVSGYTLQERVATFKPTTVLSIATTFESYAHCSKYLARLSARNKLTLWRQTVSGDSIPVVSVSV